MIQKDIEREVIIHRWPKSWAWGKGDDEGTDCSSVDKDKSLGSS